MEGVEDDDEDEFLADDPPFFLAEPVGEAFSGFIISTRFQGENTSKRGFALGRKDCRGSWG